VEQVRYLVTAIAVALFSVQAGASSYCKSKLQTSGYCKTAEVVGYCNKIITSSLDRNLAPIKWAKICIYKDTCGGSDEVLRVVGDIYPQGTYEYITEIQSYSGGGKYKPVYEDDSTLELDQTSSDGDAHYTINYNKSRRVLNFRKQVIIDLQTISEMTLGVSIPKMYKDKYHFMVQCSPE
jgi:hypothetical protein